MTREKFNQLLNYLKANHNDLYLKFQNSFTADENGFGIFRPGKVSDDEYERITSITNKWREENEDN